MPGSIQLRLESDNRTLQVRLMLLIFQVTNAILRSLVGNSASCADFLLSLSRCNFFSGNARVRVHCFDFLASLYSALNFQYSRFTIDLRPVTTHQLRCTQSLLFEMNIYDYLACCNIFQRNNLSGLFWLVSKHLDRQWTCGAGFIRAR